MAQIALVVVAEQEPRYEILVAIGYALVLPAIAVLHIRHAALRGSGAMLGTITGASTVAVGLVASIDPGLRPAALLILGMWWWTIGKMWAETGVFVRPFGLLTAAFGVLVIASAFLPSLIAGAARADLALWSAWHGVMGGWLALLAVALARTSADVPSR